MNISPARTNPGGFSSPDVNSRQIPTRQGRAAGPYSLPSIQGPIPPLERDCRASPGRFTHHLELHASEDSDDEVQKWVWIAWREAA